MIKISLFFLSGCYVHGNSKKLKDTYSVQRVLVTSFTEQGLGNLTSPLTANCIAIILISHRHRICWHVTQKQRLSLPMDQSSLMVQIPTSWSRSTNWSMLLGHCHKYGIA